jgi:type VI secretion system Hcp family effector
LISTNQEQIKADVKEFHYRRSPRELAEIATAIISEGRATSVRTPGGGRHPRDDRGNDPVTIDRFLDSWSQRFKIAWLNHEVLSSVVFEFWRPLGGRTEVYQTVRLTNAVVSSFESYTIGYDPRETIKFTFEKISYENKGGAAAAPTSWN